MAKVKIQYPISPSELEANRVHYSKLIGENISNLMLDRKLTEINLSIISGVNKMTIHKLLKYHKYEIHPNVKTLCDISMALNVSLYDLLKENDSDEE